MDVLRHSDVMNRKQLTVNGTPRKLPSLKPSTRLEQSGASMPGAVPGFAPALMPFNPPIGGAAAGLVPDGFTLGGTSMALPQIGVPDNYSGFDPPQPDPRKKRGVLSKVRCWLVLVVTSGYINTHAASRRRYTSM